MQEFLLALPVLLFSMVAHEYAHGYAALRQGDTTAYRLGRLTFNPIRHIDPWLTVIVPLMLFLFSGGRVIFGGAKPVPVNPQNYRDYRRGDIIVSAAGIAVNLALVPLFVVLTVVVGFIAGWSDVGGALSMLQRMFLWGIWLNLLLAFFNIIPIPPLDGSHLVVHVLPAQWAVKYREVSRYGAFVLLILVLVMPQALFLLLTPAIILERAACAVTAPFTLEPFPLCQL